MLSGNKSRNYQQPLGIVYTKHTDFLNAFQQYSYVRCVIRTLSNIFDITFCKNVNGWKLSTIFAERFIIDV